MAIIEVTPVTLDLEDIEINRSTTASFNIKNIDTQIITGIVVTSLESYITIKNGTNTDSTYNQSFTSDIDTNNTISVLVKITPTNEGVNFSPQVRVQHTASSYEQLVTLSFDVYEDLTNYGVIKVHKIIARDGVFSGSTVKVGTGTIKMSESGNIQSQSAAQVAAIKELLDSGDPVKMVEAAATSNSAARADKIDDGLVNPITSIAIDKTANAIIIKTNREESIKIDKEGDVFVENSVVLCQDVSNLSEDDWKLSKTSDGMTSLLRRMSGEWVTRVSFS